MTLIDVLTADTILLCTVLAIEKKPFLILTAVFFMLVPRFLTAVIDALAAFTNPVLTVEASLDNAEPTFAGNSRIKLKLAFKAFDPAFPIDLNAFTNVSFNRFD
ncbi:hypothetical protein AF821_02855 [Listeria monocytogenes]|nr:hypothetical protein AF821_02855 [Listeria monocytogenes]